MRSKVQCPVCDKRVRVSEADAGQQALCPACGTRFDLPPPPLLGEFNPEKEPVAAGAPIDPIDRAASDDGREGGSGVGAAVVTRAVPTIEGISGEAVGAPSAAPNGSPRRADAGGAGGLVPPLNPAPTPEEIRAVLDARSAYPRRH